MKSILYIKRNVQLIREEIIKREQFKYLQDEIKPQMINAVENSALGEMLNESVLNVLRDKTKFIAGENYDKLFEFAALLDKKWNKKILKVLFINQFDYHDDIINAFNEWTQYTGIEFYITHEYENSDIRVSFEKNDGHWSYV